MLQITGHGLHEFKGQLTLQVDLCLYGLRMLYLKCGPFKAALATLIDRKDKDR